MRSPKYSTLEDWVIGRIARHPSTQNSMPARMLEEPPDYFLMTSLDALDVLRDLRGKQLIAAHSKRYYLTTKGRNRWREIWRTL